jgi:succinoglycan biosynthesis transport protein ExoP
VNDAYQLIPVPERALPVVMPERAAAADRVDIRSIWSIFRRRIGLFLIVLTLSLVAGLLFTLRQTPLYMAAAQVSLNAQVDQIAPVSTTGGQTEQGAPSSIYADTQVAVITSQDMALRVADALRLADQPAFRSIPAQPPRWFGLVPGSPAIALSKEDARAQAAMILQSGVSAQRVGETYALFISWTGPDPKQAMTIANEYARQYTRADVVDKQRLSRESLAFLGRRLEQLRAQAQIDTEAVQRYRISNNLPTTTGTNLTEQEISSYNQATATARAQSAEDAARLSTARRQLSQGSNGDDVGEALQSSVVSGLRQRQAELTSQLANLRANYGPGHPEVLKVQSQLTALNGQIEAEIKRVISNLDAKQRVSAQREGSLVGTLNRASGELAQNNRAMAGLDDLTRRSTASQALYDSYLNRYKEVMAREGTEQPNARVLTQAVLPRAPVSPRPLLNMVLAIAIGLGVGLAAALAAEMLYSGLTTGDDVERLGIPYIGLIPTLSSIGKSKSTPLSAIINEPRSAFAEAFRGVRAALGNRSTGRPQVIAIASALPKEGKTTSSICLARSYQHSGKSTVLVDCDLRRQGVSWLIGEQSSRPGLLEVLRGAAPLSDALIKEGTGLHVLPISGNSSDENELLTGDAFDRLLEALRKRFEIVILDTAPLLPIADARVVVSKADAVLLMIRWRKTPDNAVRSALRMLPKHDVHLVGAVMTMVNMKKQAKFSHGDSEFYYGSYKSYYA